MNEVETFTGPFFNDDERWPQMVHAQVAVRDQQELDFWKERFNFRLGGMGDLPEYQKLRTELIGLRAILYQAGPSATTILPREACAETIEILDAAWRYYVETGYTIKKLVDGALATRANHVG